MFRRFVTLFVLSLSACQSATSTATSPCLTPTSSPPQTPIPQPTFTGTPSHTPTVPPSTVELEGAEVPEGFSLIKFADLYHSIAFTFDAQGRMYVTSQDSNVYILPDEDKDGRADSHLTFATWFYFPLGVTFHDPTGDIPFGIHQNDNLKFGPDGWLYIGVGSASKACYDTDPRSATILRFNIETGEDEIYAKGLRKPFDLAFHPVTGDLFATDNGRAPFLTETNDPETLPGDVAGCPNSNWTGRIDFISWTEATLSAYDTATGALLERQSFACTTTRFPASVRCEPK